jgi:alpha-galactosidase
MLIDDGWQRKPTDEPHYNGGPFTPNEKFGDMQEVAYQMARRGVEPGVWIRPLLTKEQVPESWLHPRRLGNRGGMFLDPTKEDVLNFVAELVSRTASWGYKMIKYDFSAPDMLTADIYDEIYLMHKI